MGIEYESEEIFKLDLKKYGLERLEGKDILTLDSTELDSLLEELGNDDVSLTVPVPCTPDVIYEILSYSECQRCGKCCQSNPLNPASPGIEAFKDELEKIASYLMVPYESIKEQTGDGKFVPHPFGWTGLSHTHWLPLPCMFYDAETKGCRVHPVRPVVCRIHPIIFTGYQNEISIKLNCDYGKDIIKKAYEYAKQLDPSLEIIL